MQLVSRQRPTSSQNITVREIGGDAIESVSENCWAQIKREAVIPISQAGGESHQKGIPRHAAAGWSRITVRELAYRREGGAARPGPTRAVDPTQATADRARLCHLFTERALFPSGAGQSRRRGQRLGRTGGQRCRQLQYPPTAAHRMPHLKQTEWRSKGSRNHASAHTLLAAHTRGRKRVI